MAPWPLGGCCTPCATAPRAAIPVSGTQARKRSVQYPAQPPGANIGIGFASAEKLELTPPANGGKSPDSPLSPASISSAAGGGATDAKHNTKASIPGALHVNGGRSTQGQSDLVLTDDGQELELWAMPFHRARRKRGSQGLKGWDLVRAKMKSLVVLHRLLRAQKKEEENAMHGFFSPRGTSPRLPTNETGSSPRSGAGTGSSPRSRKTKVEKNGVSASAKGQAGTPSPRKTVQGGREDPVSPVSPVSPLSPTTPSRKSVSDPKGDNPELRRENSQLDFAKPWQTIIVFDWDDTLFPTTYVRDDLNMSWRKPVSEQDMPKEQKKEIIGNLERCERHAVMLLQTACSFGKVVLVTLARSPWVTECCRHFYSKMGKVISDNNVPIIYAQEGTQVDYDKQRMMSTDEVESFWAGMKGKAIAKEVAKFYTQYRGQSWKNIISIGDSDFERLGAFQATEQYVKFSKVDTSGDRMLDLNEFKAFLQKSKSDITAQESQAIFVGMDANNDGLIDFTEFLDFIYSTGGKRAMQLLGLGVAPINRDRLKNTHEMTDADGRVFRIRTKSLKIIDEPTAEEMEAQLPMMLRWLPPMVFLDSGCDFAVEALDSIAGIKEIEDTLKKVPVIINGVEVPMRNIGQVLRKAASVESTNMARSADSAKGPQSPRLTKGASSVARLLGAGLGAAKTTFGHSFSGA